MSEIDLKELIRKDAVGQPNTSVEDRLNYAFMLKSSRLKVRQNSFSGFFGWFFSMKGMGVKTAIAGILLAFVMLKPQIGMTPGSASPLDSLSINQSSVIDSTVFQADAKTTRDSIF
ncbi:MAG TPA: hypothetical protein VKA27_18475 [Sunxiuqinia sp.]|nr:hypothetical protein [Sunxiuqinia sp.]